MSLPEQLQKQVDEANAILEQVYPSEDKSSEGASESGEPTETQAESNATSPQSEAPTQREDENSETYAQRWRSLQGVYNATAQKARELEARTQNLEALIQTMQAPAAPRQEIATKFLTDADSTEYGNDMIDFAKRAAKEEIAPVLSAVLELRDQISRLSGVAPVVNNLVANQRVSAEEKFFGAIAKAVPDWERINFDTKFQEWLLTPDPMTGITRQTYLEDAQKSFDAARAVNIFNIWKQVTGVPPVAQQQDRAQPNRAANELERQIAPGRSNVASAPPPSQERTWSTTDITQFYADVRRGAYKGREAERAELERDIFLAQREGRIQRSAA